MGIITNRLPSRKESIAVLIIAIVYLLATAIFVGLRFEHILMAVLFFVLYYSSEYTRKLAVALLPFIVFGVSYDWMRICPNYMVNSIDIRGLHDLELSLFGMHDGSKLVVPGEYFYIHHQVIADFFAGIFYLCWVPVPIGFALYLFFSKSRTVYLHFSLAFLLVNLIGFAGYYIHPAAPPWYTIFYGFDPILNTPGNTAGLGRFDAIVGLPIFQSLYGRNANVFAAIPSLHASYMLVTLWYAIRNHCRPFIIVLFTIIMLGIWTTAVYTAHHYIIDVILGILCAFLGIFIFEKILMRTHWFSQFFDRYDRYIK
jgi:inositol phosphorylceramide synthase catalytic subunit